MVNIKISDLSPGDEGKSINELTVWEMKTVYAGLERRYGRRRQVETSLEEPDTNSIPDTNAILGQWMDNLDFQIKDLREQLGIPQ
ncbi:hypothetical protein [Anabaena subtropica]|uniref:Uncharacterized protein n=1 Tax=Anabaena subtropica FACHB-260 TaxID=2692884 RepID=A0ABR8CRU5_9NOST|nr:hypothetical protein [Anabaena subtropica]MBD2345906.1 hypothetical protein [Anabaena subtropica FACHB-260]